MSTDHSEVNWEGYNACYDGFHKGQCPYSQAADEYGDWIDGFDRAFNEIRNDADLAATDPVMDYHYSE